MKTFIYIINYKKRAFAFIAAIICFTLNCTVSIAQCTSSTASNNSPASADNSGITFTFSQNAQRYTQVTGATTGMTYKVSSSNSLDYITIRTLNSGGTVLAYGQTPVSFMLATGTAFYVIPNTNNACGTSSNQRTITLAAMPVITSIPSSACQGSTIFITGTSLSGVTSISFNGTIASSFTINSSTSISVTVPISATTGTISVTGPGGTATSSSNLTLNTSPSVTGLTSSFEVCKNTAFNLNVSANNATTYQWQLGQVNISGATSSAYAVTSANTSNTGTYNVVVSNAFCSVTSDDIDAKLNSLPGTVITTPATSPITDCYGYINSITAKAQASQTTILTQKFNQASAAPPSGWTSSYSGSAGGTPANATWTFEPNGYTYTIYHAAFPGPYYNDYTFYSNDNTQFIMSNSDAQAGTKTSTTLTSKAVDTRPYQSLTLTYYDYFERNTGSDDTAYVQVSIDGTNFTTVQKILNPGNNGRTATGHYISGGNLHNTYQIDLSQESVDLSSYINYANLYIRFKFAAGNTGFFWAIDNVTLQGNDSKQSITWAPTAYLYTDANATIPYTSGTNLTSVYAKIDSSLTYTITASDSNGCTSVGSIAVAVSASPMWTGVTSSAWNDLNNWCNGIVPDGNTNILIPPSTPYTPLLNGDYSVNNINIAAGATLNLNGHNFTVNGAFDATGIGTVTGGNTSGLIINTNGNGGKVYFSSGTSPNSYTNNYLKTLTINSAASISLGDSLNIAAGNGTGTGTFGTVTANGTLNTNGLLTLKSNTNGDAVVGESYGMIKGNVVVERYFPPRRAWRLVTAPVNSSQTINQAWQDSVANPDVFTQLNPHPGFGTEITYDNDPSHGYDVSTTVNPSIRYWNPVINNYDPLLSGTKTTNINAYPGYYLFVRGSRAIDLSQAITAPPDPTVLRAMGTLAEAGTNSNKVLFTSSGANSPGQYVMIGNPYASPVDLTNIIDGSRAGTAGFIPNLFYVWDPKLAGDFGVGAYVTYSNGVWTPHNNESGGTYPYGDGRPVIQSGQAILIKLDNTHTTASLYFQQGDKYPSEASVFGKQQQQNSQAVFYTNLMAPSGNGLTLMDGVAAGFGKNNSAWPDSKNASKKWGNTEGVGLYRNNAWNAIEFRPVPVLTDTLFYYLNNIQPHSYTLKIMTQNIPAGFPQAWLVDKYLNTKTAVNVDTVFSYDFTANSDVNSYRNRFMLVFKRTFIATPVPVTKVINQANPGITGNANSMAAETGNVSVHPNPVKTGEKIMLQFSNMVKGKYEVTVTNTAGKALAERTIEHDGGSSSYSLQTDVRWTAGSYFVKITGENGYSLITKLVISK